MVSKLIAVFLLPIYTHYLTPSDYGAAEVMLSSVIAASIIVRFGIIEAILRFYYLAGERPARVVSTGFAALFWGATVVAAIALPFAGPISEALLRHEDAGLARLAILGLWTLTMYEYALTLLRLDERARAYFGITVANVLLTIPFTVWLIVVARGAGERHPPRNLRDRRPVHGLDAVARAPPALLRPGRAPSCGGCSASGCRRCRRSSRSTRSTSSTGSSSSGWPASPRRGCTRSPSSSHRGCRCSLAGFSSPGRRSPTRSATTRKPDASTRRSSPGSPPFWHSGSRACGSMRAGSCASSPLRTSSPSYQAIGLLATGIALYALYLGMVVILGRTGRTEFSFPATIAAVATNVALNLALVPSHGDRRGGAGARRRPTSSCWR